MPRYRPAPVGIYNGLCTQRVLHNMYTGSPGVERPRAVVVQENWICGSGNTPQGVPESGRSRSPYGDEIVNRIALFGILFSLGSFAAAANDSYLTYLQGMSEERAGNTAKALEAYEKAV